MAVTKNTNDLLAQAATNQPDNTTQQISPADVREMSENLAVSNYNKITDAALVGLKDFSTLVAYDSGQGSTVSGKIYISNKVTGPGAFNASDWDLYADFTAAVALNTAKVTNATHTGEVSGSGALTAQATIISNKTTLGSLAGTEEFLINDGGVLKKVLASNVGGSIYTADGTIGAGRVATLTDTINFTGGNVGIGISPTSKLHVAGELTVLGDGFSEGLKLKNVNSVADYIFSVGENGVSFDSLSVEKNGTKIFGVNGANNKFEIDQAATIDGNLEFKWNTNIGIVSLFDASYEQSIRFHSNGRQIAFDNKAAGGNPDFIFDWSGTVKGNLGIGTNAPTAKLHVKGINQLGTSTALLVEDSAGTDLLKVANNGSTTINGQTRISNTSGTGKFHVKGTTGGDTLVINTDSSSTSVDAINVVQNDALTSVFKMNAQGVSYWQGNLAKLHIGASGTTAVGTAMINVKGSTNTSGGRNLYITKNNGDVLVNSYDNGTFALAQSGIDFNCRLQVQGLGATSGTRALLVENSGGQDILVCRNDNAIGLYGATPTTQATTGITAGAFVANTSGTVDDSATYAGYTIGQIAQALKDLGVLA